MIDDDGAVVHEVPLPVPPATAFAMFVDPALLVRWIGLSADLEPLPGGRFRFEVAPGAYCEGRYEEIEPPHRLVLAWGWSDPAMRLPPGSSRVTVTITDRPGGCLLRLVHDQLPGDLRLLHDEGWTRFLQRLHDTLAGHDPAPYPNETPEQRRRHLTSPAQGPPDNPK